MGRLSAPQGQVIGIEFEQGVQSVFVPAGLGRKEIEALRIAFRREPNLDQARRCVTDAVDYLLEHPVPNHKSPREVADLFRLYRAYTRTLADSDLLRGKRQRKTSEHAPMVP